MRIPFFILLALLVPSVLHAGDASPSRLDSGWIQADIDLLPDGSIKVHKLRDRGPLPLIRLEPHLEKVTFPPHEVNGEAVTYRTGMFIRAFVVQDGDKRFLEFGQAFLAPIVIFYPSRPWPEAAWDEGLGGEVIFDVAVDEDGEVVVAERIGGDAPDNFNAVASDVVMATRFKAPQVNGEPVASKAIIDLYYEPAERKSARRATAAIVKLPESQADEEDPRYLEDLPAWADYHDADEILLRAVMDWQFSPEAKATEGVDAKIIHRRAVIPSEARFLLLPDTSKASREAIIY